MNGNFLGDAAMALMQQAETAQRGLRSLRLELDIARAEQTTLAKRLDLLTAEANGYAQQAGAMRRERDEARKQRDDHGTEVQRLLGLLRECLHHAVGEKPEIESPLGNRLQCIVGLIEAELSESVP